MFKTLSKNDYVPKGKKQLEQSRKQNKTNYNIGCQEWDSKWNTINSMYQQTENLSKIERQPPLDKTKLRQAQFTIGSEHLVPKQNYNGYQSEKNGQFQDFGYQKRQPILSKQDLSKTNYKIGEEKVQYNTTNNDFDSKFKNSKLPDIKFKEDRVRYDIIRNKDIDQQQLKQQALAFDFYNPEKPKARITRDYSHIPRQGERREDPITGRKLKY